MKNTKVIAAMGTVALLANLLLPTLSLAQVPASQTGTAELGCSLDAPAFGTAPANFPFYTDGTAPIISSLSTQPVFSSPNDTVTPVNFVSVVDPRDPSKGSCGNDGLTLDVQVVSGQYPDPEADADGHYFDLSDDLANDAYIPLEDVYMVSDADSNVCPAGFTAVNNICFEDTAQCGNGNSVANTLCTTGTYGTASLDAASNAYGTVGTYATNFGTDATPASLEVLSFADGAELYGEAGISTAFYAQLPAGLGAGTYEVDLLWTYTPLDVAA